ncbi:transport permease protein [Kitasatospora indigofera]|uniref:Transport permease protein n=1 Tax=Kitasatospora indigofera TaxID=67307 RepID=A0A919KLK2_9ACTN|nr:ABC transporter permease [Kitasatospora indigofera]GHH62992.1 transport permease protein [Kitasatospora indigofera]
MTAATPTTPASPATPGGAPGPVGRPAAAWRAVLRAEARLFRREPLALFWIVLFPALLVTILGLVPAFRQPQAELGGRRVIDLYVPVAVLLALILSGLQAMPPVLAGYRERGILRRMSTTPVRPGALLAAQILLHGAAALGSAALSLTVGRLAFGVALPRQAPGYLLALLLAALAALGAGAGVAALSRTTKIASAAAGAVTFPMMFGAGVWIPVQAMPDLLRSIVSGTPFGAGAQALGQAAAGDWPSWSHLGVMALWAVVLTGTASRWFRWA